MLRETRMVRLSIAPATERTCGDGSGAFCSWLHATHLGAEQFCLIFGTLRDENGWLQRAAGCVSAEAEEAAAAYNAIAIELRQTTAERDELRASLAAAQASAARLLSVARRLAEDEKQTRGDE